MKRFGILMLVVAVAVIFTSCEDMFFNGKKGNSLSNEVIDGSVSSEVIANSALDQTTTDQHSVCLEKMGNLGVSGKLVFGGPGMFGMGPLAGFGKGPIDLGPGFKGHHLSSCATVTQSSTTFPKEIVIDYGTGCTDERGPAKKGKIVITVSDSMIYAGAVHTVKYVDFYIGDRKIEGTETITNKGKNAEGLWVIESKSNQTITHEDGTVTTRTNEQVQTWVAGFETADRADNEFYRSGSSSSSIGDTLKYSSTITQPLLFKASCRTIVSGIVEINIDEQKVVIDYGDGECDNLASVTKDGETTEINLERRKMDGKQIRQCVERNGFGPNKHGKGGR